MQLKIRNAKKGSLFSWTNHTTSSWEEMYFYLSVNSMNSNAFRILPKKLRIVYDATCSGDNKKDSTSNSNECICLGVFFQCKCWPGFQLKDDGKTCTDIDECSSGFPCSQQCINTYGTYKCLCADGYEIQPDNLNGCKSLSGIAFSLQLWL